MAPPFSSPLQTPLRIFLVGVGGSRCLCSCSVSGIVLLPLCLFCSSTISRGTAASHWFWCWLVRQSSCRIWAARLPRVVGEKIPKAPKYVVSISRAPMWIACSRVLDSEYSNLECAKISVHLCSICFTYVVFCSCFTFTKFSSDRPQNLALVLLEFVLQGLGVNFLSCYYIVVCLLAM